MAQQQISETQLLAKARAYCARQERCQQELRDKAYSWGAHREQVEQVIAQVIGEGFLNEARFAEHYAVSKSRQKGWGRRKIEQALKAKCVSEHCIIPALNAIDGDEEEKQLKQSVAKRWDKGKGEGPYVRKGKLMRYFTGRGFARERIEAALEAVLKESGRSLRS